MDIAVAHKDYDVRGGGEFLAEESARTFNCPMWVGNHDPERCNATDIDIHEIDKSRVAEWAIERGGPLRSLAYLDTWQRVPELADYETVITSGNEPLWYVPPDEQTVLAYIHSPPRYQYDLFQASSGRFQKLYSLAVRVIFDHNMRRPDYFVANSDLVKRRICRYFDIDPERVDVVYPPVETDAFSPNDAPDQDYYVHVGRLSENKALDEVIRVFNETGRELRIAGRGPQRERLEEMANENVVFEGYVSQTRKEELLSGARAFVFNGHNEDFGMAPVEAMAAGTPVVGVREGFTQFQVMDRQNHRFETEENWNGVTYERGSLRAALEWFEDEGVRWSADEIATWANDHFSVGQFRQGLRDAVEAARNRSDTTPEWSEPQKTTL
ncbi:Glycosyltransferase involved in cell wall bisynthesis [Halorientalis persicus]|uniref:Glycosyltransferase involved in cell wall bisynthesis n=1 Tax=Halorientalis persicus TaxID=1367881 RepID=A0A1H8WLA9_9EURY|nr:glycosyltransferase [Halorientalis persicus]SEP28227.1 Glycosyltransferase involved in cell wall bisynthesis [Halorientalis persicus]